MIAMKNESLSNLSLSGDFSVEVLLNSQPSTSTRIVPEIVLHELGLTPSHQSGVPGTYYANTGTLRRPDIFHKVVDMGLLQCIPFAGIAVLLVTKTQSWDNVISNKGAWDTFIWLGGLLAMANLLKEFGFVDWVASGAGGLVQGLPALAVVVILAMIYYYSMYSFSMLTAHISAMVAAFLLVADASGAPPILAVALMAYFSNLCASTTNYSTGPVVIYFGMGYVPAPLWFRTGFVVSLFHMLIWLTVGLLWWKFLGWW